MGEKMKRTCREREGRRGGGDEMHGRLALTPSPTQSGHKSHANLTAMSWVGGLGGRF